MTWISRAAHASLFALIAATLSLGYGAGPAHAALGNATLVRAPDGSTRPVNNFQVGDLVVTRDGIREIVGYSSGATMPGPAVLITTANGIATVATADQLFMAPTGLVAAADLRAGDYLVDAAFGRVAIHSVATGSYEAGMHNLVAGGLNDPSGPHTFIANGLVVADYYTIIMSQPDQPDDS